MIIALDYALRIATRDHEEESGFAITLRQGRRHPAVTLTDRVKEAAKLVDLPANESKTDYMISNQPKWIVDAGCRLQCRIQN